MGWAGLQNGALLRAAEDNGVDVLLTGDQTLTDEQNLIGRRLAIVVLSDIRLPIIKEHLSKIIAAIDKAVPGSFQAVECGTFSRKRTREEQPPNDHSYTSEPYSLTLQCLSSNRWDRVIRPASHSPDGSS
jgi:hypothetical protein